MAAAGRVVKCDHARLIEPRGPAGQDVLRAPALRALFPRLLSHLDDPEEPLAGLAGGLDKYFLHLVRC